MVILEVRLDVFGLRIRSHPKSNFQPGERANCNRRLGHGEIQAAAGTRLANLQNRAVADNGSWIEVRRDLQTVTENDVFGRGCQLVGVDLRG